MAKKNNNKVVPQTATNVVASPVVAPKVVAAPAKAQVKAVEPVANQPASDETRANRSPSHDEIARRAFELWVGRGGMGGNAQEDWLRAEQELRARR